MKLHTLALVLSAIALALALPTELQKRHEGACNAIAVDALTYTQL
jgi:hypothetical protein